MNDLEYRRKQLLKLQDVVIDLEDLSTGVSIAEEAPTNRQHRQPLSLAAEIDRYEEACRR